MTHPIRRAVLALLLTTAAVAGAGCGKDKQSLVLADLRLATAGTQASNLGSVTLAADPGPTKTYPTITMLSGDTGVTLGLYLPGSVTGDVTITATAQPMTGCAGFRGTGHTTIDAAGVTRSVTILLSAADVCPADGGAGGTSGSAGTTGSAGTGGSAGTTGSAGTGGSTSTGSAGTGGGGTTGSAGTGGGSAGRGGTTGSAGRGGTTGSAGTGGGAGTTGSGGRGGSAGTTGTGGMAGYPSISGCRSFSHAATSGCPNVSVNSVAISPNGQLVATGGNDYRVKIWNFDGRNLTQTGTVFMDFNTYTVVFSPDGTRLAYTFGLLGDSAIGVRTYTVSNWTAGTTYQDDGSKNILVGVAFTPDSQRLVSVNAIGNPGGNVFVHNVGGSAQPAYTAHVPNEPYTLAVSPRAASDGSVGIAVGSYYGLATVFSLGASGFAAAGSKDVPATAMARVTYSAAFSPDGSLLVTGEDYGAVRFFAYPLAATPTPIAPAISFAGGDNVNALAFAPNGMYLAVGGAFGTKQLSIYSVATHLEAERSTPTGDVTSLAFAPNGNAIIAGLDACGTVIVCAP